MAFYDIFNFTALPQGPIVLFVCEFSGGAFAAVPPQHCIIMEGKTIHAVANILHQDLSPVIIIVTCTTGNFEQAVAIIIAAIGCVTTINI